MNTKSQGRGGNNMFEHYRRTEIHWNSNIPVPEIKEDENVPFTKVFRIKVRVDGATAKDRIKLYNRLRQYLGGAGILMCGQTLSITEITEEEEKEKKLTYAFEQEENDNVKQ
jgi:hypothetical protein